MEAAAGCRSVVAGGDVCHLKILTNQKTVFKVMTNQKTVFLVLTNQKTVLVVVIHCVDQSEDSFDSNEQF